MTTRSGRYLTCAAAIMLAACCLPALAQQYPTRAVRLVVPFAPGGSTDVQEKLAGLAMDVAASTPEEYRAFIKAQIAQWTPVVKATGARGE